MAQWIKICFVMLLSFTVLAGPSVVTSVYAQDDAAAADAGGDAPVEDDVSVPDGPSLWETIKGGGLIGFIIILLSVVGMTLSIENLMSVKREKLVPPELVAELEGLFEEENYEEAIDLCQAEDCFLTRIVGAGMSKVNAGFEPMMQAVGEVGEQEATLLHQKIGWLAMIGSLSPMIGLLGTVTGMIAAFNVIATKPNPAPAELAGGISMALVTTCLGLVVAIPTMAVFAFLRNRVTKVVMEAGTITGELLERFRPEE